MIKKINDGIGKLKTFSQLKIMKLGQINKIIDKKSGIVNNLFTNFKKMTSAEEALQSLNLFLKKKEKFIKIDSVSDINEKTKSTKNKNKLILRTNKPIKYNYSFNMKKNSLSKSCTNKLSKTQNTFSFNIKSPLKDKTISYSKINPINMKNTKILINSNYKEKNLFKKKLEHSKRISYKMEDSKNGNQYNTFYDYKSDGSGQKTFITQQKVDIGRHTHKLIKRNNTLDKTKLNNFNISKFKTQQSFFKHLSKDVLSDYINSSSNIFNQQYNKFLEEEETVNMTINNIKNMLKENEMRKSSNRDLYISMINDVDIPRIKKSIKLFQKSFKGKILFKDNNLFNSSMITKKVADIVNFWDIFNRINEIYFYKNNKSFFKVYPPVSEKAKTDPLDSNYELKFLRLLQKNKHYLINTLLIYIF